MQLDPRTLADDELAPFYFTYRDRVPAGDLLAFLEDQRGRYLGLLAPLEESRRRHRYAEGKWSLAELLGHVVDIERTFSYRLMTFSRGLEEPLPGVDHEQMVARGGFDDRDWDGLVGEFDALRTAGLHLARSLDEAALTRRGTASGYSFSTRGMLVALAGHAQHHLEVMQERYLP